MRIADAIADYLLDRASLSRDTRDWYQSKLAMLAAWLADAGVTEMEGLTAPLLRRFAASVPTRTNPQTGQPLSSYTAHGYAQVIKGWLRWCGQEGYCDEKLYTRVTLPPVVVTPIHPLTRPQVEALLAATKTGQTPQLVARDRALLTLLLSTGVRVGEACGLTLANLKLDNPDDPHLHLQRTKGSKWREVGLSAIAVRYLRRYLRLRTARPGVAVVFTNQKGRPMTASGVDQMLRRLKVAAEADGMRFDGVKMAAHTLRHTFAVTYMTQPGADAFKLQTLLGHSSITTTTGVYLRGFRQRDARRGPNPLDTLLGG